ncbi:MAG: hypothetical protein K0R18_2535 [Bacillales bacterium]|jgi:hypothetical protein|nr:hypothetical protein [Bacillales bacterium]
MNISMFVQFNPKILVKIHSYQMHSFININYTEIAFAISSAKFASTMIRAWRMAL